MTEVALFDASPYAVAPAAPEKLSPGRRRTLRQADNLAHGIHPLIGGRLHADAAPADDRKAEGLRCSGCVFRALLGHHGRTYPKCTYPVVTRDGEPITAAEFRQMVFVAHSGASDCRGWWPACGLYQPIPRAELVGQTDILAVGGSEGGSS